LTLTGYSIPLLDADIETAKAMFDLNVFAPIALAQAFAPLLIRSQGTILNIGSIAGLVPFPWQGMYNASKAALNLLTDNLRLELEPLGVTVVLTITGGVASKFAANVRAATNVKDGVLKPDSVYKVGEEDLAPTLRGEGFDNFTSVDVYAESVVNAVLKKNPPKHVWGGSGSTTVWFANVLVVLFGQWIWVSPEFPFTVNATFLIDRADVMLAGLDFAGKDRNSGAEEEDEAAKEECMSWSARPEMEELMSARVSW